MMAGSSKWFQAIGLLSLLGTADIRCGEVPSIPLLVITDLRTIGDEVSVAEASAFSEFIRQQIETSGKYRVLSRSSMMAILKANAFPLPCYELPCFAAMGRLLGADQVLAGNLQRRGSTVDITLRLIDVQKVKFMNTVYRSSPSVPVEQLMGEWGLEIIGEAFHVDLKKLALETASHEALPTVGHTDATIPDSVKNKYPGMIYIPAGEVVMGSDEGDACEQPPHSVRVKAFYIGKFEVTNKEYEEFVRAAGRNPPFHWSGGVIPPGLENHPVTWVSYEDAEAYCAWCGARLPTEAEWERAAKDYQPRVYPWGDTFDSNRANTWEAGRGDTSPAGSYYQGASPFGVEDMAGNAFEWVAGFFEPYPGAQTHLEDYDKHLRVLRGGSWNFNAYYARATHRFARSGGEKGRSYGFRIAREP